MNGAEYICAFLRDKGVTTAFGYPGANIIELYDALAVGDIQNIICRHEQGAVHAATGYAKASGHVGVCLATSGPGAANLISGIADAYLDSAPLLVITGQVGQAAIGRDAFQEADIMGMTIPVTKHNYLVRDARHLAVTLEEAWKIASTPRRGPVLIDICSDVFKEQIVISEGVVRLPRVVHDYMLMPALPKIASALSVCHRPLILMGGGVVADGASEALARFAAASGIPVAATLMAKGSMVHASADVCFLGLVGAYGSAAARRALAECDLVIASGTRFSERTVGNYDSFSRRRFVIHNDIDAAEISKNVRTDIGVVCGAGDFFSALGTARPTPDRFSEWRSSLCLKEPESLPDADSPLSMREVMETVMEVERALTDTVFVTDVGENQMAAATLINPVVERGFITSGGLGIMGFGLPGAIGAAFAVSDCGMKNVKQIIALIGDGGFQMTLQELATLHFSPLPIKIILLDNNALGMLRAAPHTQSFTMHCNPNFAALAGAYGLDVLEVSANNRSALMQLIETALTSPVSTLVHCVVD